jgi:hypothetical protein
MTTIIITPKSNTKGKKDFTGAFKPEALAFKKRVDSSAVLVSFDNTLPMPGRRQQLYERLHEVLAGPHPVGSIDTLAIFCHGWSTGIQAGLTTKDCHTFATVLAPAAVTSLTVALYCCSTGADPGDNKFNAPGSDVNGVAYNLGDGSFADTLRDELCKVGLISCRVMAHRTAGHTTHNPQVIFFDGDQSPLGGTGGTMPVTPRLGKKLWNTWVRELKTPFRFDMLRRSVVGIHEHLLKKARAR